MSAYIQMIRFQTLFSDFGKNEIKDIMSQEKIPLWATYLQLEYTGSKKDPAVLRFMH